MRFVTEYYNFKCRQISDSEYINKGIKKEILRRLANLEKAYKNGFITTDEIMYLISCDACTDDEDMEQYVEV